MHDVLTALVMCRAYQHALDVYDFGIKTKVAQDKRRLEQLVCGLEAETTQLKNNPSLLYVAHGSANAIVGR